MRGPMNFTLKTAAIAVMAASLVAAYASAEDAAPPAKKHVATRKAKTPPPPTVAEQIQALRQDQTLSQQDRHSKIMAIRQDTRTRLEAALNDQQKQQLEEMRAKMEARHQHMGGQNQAPPSATAQPE